MTEQETAARLDALGRYDEACFDYWYNGDGWRHLSPYIRDLNSAIECGWDRADRLGGIWWDLLTGPELVNGDPHIKKVRNLIKRSRQWKLNKAPAFRYLDVDPEALKLWKPEGFERLVPASTWNFWQIDHHNRNLADAILSTIFGLIDEMGVSPEEFDEWKEIERAAVRADYHSWAVTPFWPATETEEQRDLREYKRAMDQRDEDEAGTKARDLLLRHLDEQQQEDFLTKRFFHAVVWGPLDRYALPTKKRKLFERVNSDKVFRYRRYRIEAGYVNGNVHLMNGHSDKIVRTFCLHPPEPFPSCDTLLAQKFLIESNEAKFLSDANWSLPSYRDDYLYHTRRYARQL